MRVASIPDRFTTTPSNTPSAPVTPGAPAGPALIVGNIWAPSELQDDRIRYRIGSNEVGAYEFHRWIERPGTMISESLVQALRASGKYRSVMESSSAVAGDYHLRGRLYEFDEVDRETIQTSISLRRGSGGYEDQAGGLGRSREARGARPRQDHPGRSRFSRSESAGSRERNGGGNRPFPGVPTLMPSPPKCPREAAEQSAIGHQYLAIWLDFYSADNELEADSLRKRKWFGGRRQLRYRGLLSRGICASRCGHVRLAAGPLPQFYGGPLILPREAFSVAQLLTKVRHVLWPDLPVIL